MAKASWISPEEKWPNHSRPQARAALQTARKAGWWLKKAEGKAKSWGVITCGDPDLPSEQRCRTSVLSTSGSGDGSETAAVINDLVRKCTHQRASTAVVEALEEAQALLSQAKKCLEAARRLIEEKAHRDLVEDFLQQSETAAAQADELLASAVAEEELANQALEAAETAAEAGGAGSGLGPAGLAQRARDNAAAAKELVSGDTGRDARILRNQCEDVRNQARELLDQLQ